MRIIRVVVAALLLGAGLAVTAATPAQAAFIDCPNGRVCLFRDLNGTGGILVSIAWSPGTCYNVPTDANDRATSYVNRLPGTRHMQVYRNAGCSGHALHKDNGFGGSTQPFPSLNAPYPEYLNSSGNFINVDSPVIPGCSVPDHCDNDIATSIWFNTG